MKYAELLKTFEYIFNADASLLYSASMAGFELLEVKYLVGKSRFSEHPKKEFEKGKYGLYEVFFICP